mgnify:CR=1
DWLNGDWGIFFIITALMVVPSLMCLMLIKNKIKFKILINYRGRQFIKPAVKPDNEYVIVASLLSRSNIFILI